MLQQAAVEGLPYPDQVVEAQSEIDWYFPKVDPGHEPLGARVLIQVRRVRLRSKGGIVLASETKETEKWNTQVGKIISIGPLAFRNRETRELWPEGMWAQVGDYVRIPRWSGDRWEVPLAEGSKEEPALFVVCNDHEIIARVTGNPIAVRAFIL